MQRRELFERILIRRERLTTLTTNKLTVQPASAGTLISYMKMRHMIVVTPCLPYDETTATLYVHSTGSSAPPFLEWLLFKIGRATPLSGFFSWLSRKPGNL